MLKDFSASRNILALDHRYPENIQSLFHMQKCLSHKSSTTWKYSKVFSPAQLFWPEIFKIPKIFKDFFACRIVLAADHRYPEIFQKLFHLQNCVSRKSSTTWNYSKTFSTAKLSGSQIFNNLEISKDFSSCKIVLAANHRYPEKIQTLLHLQICLSRKSSTTWKNSKTFLPAEFSQTQTINNLEIIKDFFACKTALAANHNYPENIQRLFRLQNCLGRISSIPRKYSKNFSPAKLSGPQIINIPKLFKDFFACGIVLDANHQKPEIIQRFLRLQKCLSRRSSMTRKYSNTFSPADTSQSQIINNLEKLKDFIDCRILLDSDHQQPGNNQKFSPANLSWPQIITIPKTIKDFFARRSVLAANHQQPGKIQRLFRLQNCLGRRLSIPRKYSKFFPPAEVSQTQIINNLELIKDFFACKTALAANRHYPENIQRPFHLQNCLSRKSSIT